jgi:PAS domain S-box-containing protein
MSNQITLFRRFATQCLVGGIILALLTFVCFQIGFKLGTTGFVYLTAIVLLSLRGSFASSAILSLAAIACLSYFFASPTFGFKVNISQDIVLTAAFLLTTLIVTRLVTRVRRQAEAALQSNDALRRSEAYLHEAQKLGRMGSWAQNLSSETLSASPELLRIFGRDADKEKPTAEMFREIVHPEDRPFVKQAVNQGRNSKADFGFDHRIVLPDGTIKHVHSVAHPVINGSGDLVEYIGTIMDVTERKHAEEALHQAQADLAHASRVTVMGELTASLAHEVNQPIAAAVINASACLGWLAGTPPNIEEARDAANRIVNDGTRAAEIVSRIRLFFKKEPPKHELINMDEVIRETIVLLRAEATRYSISIRTWLAAGFPQVMADHVQLQQVIMNLIMNGIDAMKDVDGARELCIRSQLADSEEIMVSVSDTGVGLPPQLAGQIFDAFFTTKTKGTGMGLPISRSIVEAHGGRLWATPNAPCGATFRFVLPVKDRPMA